MGMFSSRKKTKKPILFISSSLYKDEKANEIFDYFAKIIAGLTIKIRRELPDYDLVIKIPDTYDGASEQDKFLEILLEEKKIEQYSAVIIAPKTRSRIISNLIQLKKRNPNFPIFAIDKGFDAQEYKQDFINETLDPPFSVQANWEQGGRLAARCYETFLNNTAGLIAPYLTIILNGLEGSKERINGFTQELYQNNIQICPKLLDSDFTRENAYSLVKRELEGMIRTHSVITGIFCCNDEMALGTKDALDEMLLHHPRIVKPAVIGFDGIRDITMFLNNSAKSEYVINTVTVALNDQISILIDAMKSVLNGTVDYKNLVSPRLVKCGLYVDNYNKVVINTNGLI